MPSLRSAVDRAFKRSNLFGLVLPIALLAAVLAGKIYEPAFVGSLRLMLFDTYQRIHPRPYQPVPVRIVDIDDQSLTRIGQWPWPRDVLANLVDRLDEAGAAVIAFDSVFAEPDRHSPALIAESWRQGPAELAALAPPPLALPDYDSRFAASIAAAPVVIGHILTNAAGARLPEVRWGMATNGDDPRRFVYGFDGAATALPQFEAAAQGNGSLNVVPDADGVIRRVPLLFRAGDLLVPSLAAEALRVAQGAGTYVVRSSGASGVESFGASSGVADLRIGGLVIETDPRAAIWIHFTGPRPERFVPAWQVLADAADPALLAGHIVLVGTSAAGLRDLRATPLDSAAPGVEVHAQLLEQLLTGARLNRPDWAPGAEFSFIAFVGLLLIVLLQRMGPILCAVVGAVTAAAAFAGSWLVFVGEGLLIDPLIPALSVLAVYLVTTLIGYIRTDSERAFVRRAFGRYLSPDLVTRLAADPGQLNLGGSVRPLTVMFCDIRGFTSLSEQYEPEALTQLVNRFLTPMSADILDRQGTIDKYIGDCIMAFWNAPLDDPDHAANACGAALAMRASLTLLNLKLAHENAAAGLARTPLAVGIGLNTGDCLVGNMGSDQRFNYSALGDAVNLAARLEGQCRSYGVDIILSEATRAAAGPLATLELDLIRVKGRSQPAAIHALVGPEEQAGSAAFKRQAACHAAMLAAYRAGKWAVARARLAEARAADISGLADFYDLYASRLDRYAAEPPATPWDGVHVATEK
ncbi:MAG: CHASE2 domain-containing protein [Alphaproteobacteria bacterium]